MPDITRAEDPREHGLQSRPVCSKLRCKSMFIDAEPDPSVPSMRSGFVWCAWSLNCLGPDGKVACRDACRPGRPCYEVVPSPSGRGLG